jgi:selenocysteine lyase/cysteine desulfurase
VDLRAFRASFPALERLVWLNTATVPPGAGPVLEAVRRALADWERGAFSWQDWEADAYATRGLFAGMLGVPDQTVALMSSVAEAASTVAAALPAGKVVVGSREFHSNLYPWIALRDRGFDVVEVPHRDGVVPTGDLAATVDEQTVLLAVTEVQSSNGYRVDVGRLAERCRETGARLFVNLTQSLGALRFDAPAVGADFVAAHGYKWLLGVRGAAWMHVRQDRIADLLPHVPNWHTPADPYADYYGSGQEPGPGATRLDTSFSWLPWIGSRAALELLAGLDPAEVEARCLSLSRAFRDGARERGFDLVPEEVPSQTVGVVVSDADALQARLAERSVIGAVRGGFLRLGFHAFNDETDLEAALDALI